jgi:hypothetical protein
MRRRSMSATYDRRRARRLFVGVLGQAAQHNPTGKGDRHDRQAESDAFPRPALDPRASTCRVAIAALPGSLHRGLGIGELSARRENQPERTRSGGMAARVGELILPLAGCHVTLLFEQRAEVESAVGLAPLACAGVALLRRTHIAA